ncbi:hypothetical protein DYBT9275_01074 [Dyadobacter sp. CECT 9275]|uniref:N-acetyltransferase domain-containing protein n=1 Tax=Dyadobacter helix TaxID=2822344 RepID=A0A916NBA0_9BACT|nr:GNAT family N-acetyltransferase [Dyadobacter sp. CECT 9275]CAG4992952.1 hypothetical protein DYBT9275_01074 [Dyadobacter sp. CECT 9275]
MLEITPYRITQQNELVSMILEIQQNEFNIPITAKDQPDLYMIDAFYRKNGGEFWTATHNGTVVGSIALIKISNRCGVIRKMFVKKEFRGKEFCIAQKLLDKLVDYSIHSEIGTLYLGTIDKLKAALRFYEKNDFLLIDKAQLPIDFPVMEVDNVFCRRHLKSPVNN